MLLTAGVSICVGCVPARGSAVHREQPVCPCLCPHLRGEDGRGRVRHCHVAERHPEGHLHNPYQGKALPSLLYTLEAFSTEF